MASEQFRYRELLYTLASRDIRTRYKHSLIGFGWALFVPVLMIAVISTFMKRIATIDTHGAPYSIWLCCGLLPWEFFSQSVIRGSQSLVVNRSLATKIYFAREALPFAAILTAGFDFLISSSVLAAMMVWYKVVPEWTIAFVPVVLLIQLVFTAGVVLILSLMNLFYRDVGRVIGVVMRAWMFITAVIYTTEGTGWLRVLNTLNPMTPIIMSYRALILEGRMPDWSSLGPAAAVSVVVLIVGWTAFHLSEFRFAENL
jgi:ABC-type polysaccharide/polyol phosphate export permease